METRADTEGALKAELTHYAAEQARNLYADYYLYYRESTPRHAGKLLIAQSSEPGSEFVLARTECIDKGATIAQNFNQIRLNTLPHLPILDA